MFNLTETELISRKAIHTAREIYQQPEVWEELFGNLKEKMESHKSFIKNIYDQFPYVRVIFTGAGTSAFAGDTIVPELRRQAPDHISMEAIATTDIVSNPDQYLKQNIPTILVSFARSGNSPESVAAVELGKQYIKDFYQVIITCNKDGNLAKFAKHDDNCLLVLLPDRAHDLGFAMTSSFTTMVLAAYLLFAENELPREEIKQIGEKARALFPIITKTLDEVLTFDFDRVVYVGSGLLGQLSHEASLKMLELTAGKTVAVYESTLGFRHGPKSILNDHSLLVMFFSSDPYTRKYDLDLLKEIANGSPEVRIVALSEYEEEEVARLADWAIHVNAGGKKLSNDFSLALLYILFAQSLALKKSLQLGITPDNPSPDGKVNRVVKGVTIYPWNRE